MTAQPGLAAEQSLLGALLMNGRLDAVPPDLRPDDFGSVTHQRIYATMKMLHADGLVVDLTTVYEALRDRVHRGCRQCDRTSALRSYRRRMAVK